MHVVIDVEINWFTPNNTPFKVVKDIKNRTIFRQDVAKNVKNKQVRGGNIWGGGVYCRGAIIGGIMVYQYINQML